MIEQHFTTRGMSNPMWAPARPRDIRRPFVQSVRARIAPVLLSWLVLLSGAAFAESSSVRALQVDVLADELDGPWGLAFLPDGRMLVSERGGALLLLDAQGNRLATVRNVPEAFVKLQGGLLDVALHPKFDRNSIVYLSLAYGRQKHNTTRVVRAVLKDESLENVEVIFDTTPKGTSVHYGGRLAFMRDGTLLVTTGEGAEYREDAQRLDSLLGKVVRINDDGTIPADNPFVDTPGAEPAVWSYGHRNPQGLYVDPESDAVYAAEHGPRGGDEINVIEKGINYGWPIATHGIDYTGGRISPFETYPGMREPLVYWTPSIGPGGIAMYRGAMFPEWEGDLLVAVLGHTHLRRVDMEDGRVIAQYPLLEDRQARFRQVEIGPDGALYALVEGVAGADRSGQVLRISARGHNPAAASRRSELLSEAGDRSLRSR
jgi:glucose/arabinose dehydrogenase